MKRRRLIYSLTLVTGVLATGGLSAMNGLAASRPVLSRAENEMLEAFRAQVAAYPFITADLLQQMTEAVALLEREPGRLKFRNAANEIVELKLNHGRLRAKVG